MTTFSKEVKEFFNRVVRDVINMREQNNTRRNDFMQILIDMKNNVKVDENNKISLTVEEIVAQSFVFFVAGFDTSSTAMHFALYELARDDKLQQKARKEIDDLYERNGGRLTYDGVMELKFLSQIIDGRFVVLF